MPLGEFSIICFEFLDDFWRKSQKGEKKEKLGKKKKSGHFAAVKGCLTTEGPEKAPLGFLRYSLATPRRSASPLKRHCSQRQNFRIFVPKA